MIRSLPEAAALLDAQGMVLAANGAAADALGIEEKPAPSLGQSELVYDPDGLFSEQVRLWSRTTSPVPGAFSIRRLSETIVYACRACLVSARTDVSPAVLLLRFWPRSDESPFVLLSQKVAELNAQIARRQRAEEELRRSQALLQERAQEAEALNRVKDEFLATLSHELRTPLNAILGWTGLLRESKLDESRRIRGLDTIERNARAQAQLIDDLLDISRIVSGKLRLNVQQLNPVFVVEAALDAVRPAADAKSIRLQAVLDPQAGPILGDPDRLQQLCWNLLSNSIKFTPKNGRVQVLLERVNSHVELTVSDTGVGIRPEFLPHVFERFQQQDGSTVREHRGLGLGLSIVKSLVELHGGSVRAESPGIDQGATFIVRLPRALLQSSSEPRPFETLGVVAPLRAKVLPELAGLTLVVVDDDADALELMVILLEQCGAKVKAARTATEAFAAVQTVRPDILISDIGMPGEDGYQLVRRIRALPAQGGGRTAAVALTAFARATDRTRALRSGFQAHVPKPVEPDELLAVVASLAQTVRDRA